MVECVLGGDDFACPAARGDSRNSLADWFALTVMAYEPFNLEDQKVLTIKQWCALNGFSVPTGNRVLARGDGPPTIQLSPRRKGIRVGDNRRWQESRVRSA